MDDDLASIDDVDRLWSMLVDARKAGADALAQGIRARMRQLEQRRRFAEVTDLELDRRIAALQQASHVDEIKRAGITEESNMNRHLDELNDRMSDAARPGAADHLADLLAERQRRTGH